MRQLASHLRSNLVALRDPVAFVGLLFHPMRSLLTDAGGARAPALQERGRAVERAERAAAEAALRGAAEAAALTARMRELEGMLAERDAVREGEPGSRSEPGLPASAGTAPEPSAVAGRLLAAEATAEGLRAELADIAGGLRAELADVKEVVAASAASEAAARAESRSLRRLADDLRAAALVRGLPLPSTRVCIQTGS